MEMLNPDFSATAY